MGAKLLSLMASCSSQSQLESGKCSSAPSQVNPLRSEVDIRRVWRAPRSPRAPQGLPKGSPRAPHLCVYISRPHGSGHELSLRPRHS